MKSFLSSFCKLDRTANTLTSHQTSKSIDLHLARTIHQWKEWQKGLNLLLLCSSVWGGTVLLDTPTAQAAGSAPSTCGAIDLTGYTSLTFSLPSSTSTPTRYTNVGTFNGTQIDVVMTRTALTGLAPTAPQFSGNGNATLLADVVAAGRYTVRMDFFQTGTTTPINVNVSLLYQDLDGGGGPAGDRWEQLLVPASEVRSFTVANNSRLLQSAAGANLQFRGTVSSPNSPQDAVQIDYVNRSSITFTYEKNSATYGNLLAIAGGQQGFFPPTPTCQTPSLTTVDYGDALDSYGTDNIASNSGGDGLGATHTIVSGLRIGSTAPDAESNASVPLNGTGDGSDEGGVVFPSLSQSDSTYSIPNIPVTNTTGTTAYLVGWLDLDKNGKFDNDELARVAVPSGTSSVNLTWGSLPGITAGTTYARFRLTTDSSIASATNAVPNSLAADGEVEDYPVAIAAPDPNTIVPTGSFCQTSGGTPGLNQASSEFGGTFGTLASGYRNLQNPPAAYGYRNTSFLYQGTYYGVLVEPAVYTVTSQSGSGANLNVFGPWRTVTGVTTGAANDAYLAVNGDVAVGNFIIQPITVQPNTNYEFGIWAMNVHGATSPYGGVGEEPNVGIEIDGITNVETGFLTKGANWKRGSVLFNSGNRTSITLKMRNISTSGLGNDFYVDGMFGAKCNNLPVGNVTGIVYTDTNGDGTQDAGELGIAGTTLTLKDKNGVPVTTTTDSTGSYTFSNIADLAALENYSVTVDATSTPVAGKASTTPTLTNNINVSAGNTISGGNYGFKPPKANVLLVKRITAIKPVGATTATNYNTFDTTSPSTGNDRHCNWPLTTNVAGACTNTYTLGKIDGGLVKPGDEIEYTIYYLNAGANKAKQARICDQLSSNLTFQGDTPTTPVTTAPLNIQLFPGSAGPLESLTNSTTDADKGQLTTAALATSCNLAGNTGTNPSDNVVIVDVATPTNPLLGSTGAGIPTTSYGYIRIKTTVK